jgi:hypothetical protein
MAVDWRCRREADDPLDMWEVLAEEFEASGKSLGGLLDVNAQKYFEAKEKFENEKQKDERGESTPDALAEANDGFNKARRAVESDLFCQFHAHSRTAICFSGGGVRSATFGLGVLHGLAKLDPVSPLPQFDFLSTVSGGGYVGSWFSAWAARKELASPGTNGAETVTEELAATALSTLDPEPEPLLHIRRYGRFLNPKMGLLSADAWTLVATVARNMILNWLILVPLIMAVLLIPLLYLSIMDVTTLEVEWTGVWLALICGMLAGVVATYYIACHLPTLSGVKNGDQGSFLWFVLLPLGISAIFLTLHWAWREQLAPHNNYEFYQFMAIGATIHFLGGACGAIKLWSRAGKAPLTTLFVLLAAAVSGAVAGWLAYLASKIFLGATPYLWQLFTCLAVPFVLLAFSAAALLTVGLASQVTDDEDREWWSRAGGWLLILTTVWLIFSAAVVFIPDLLVHAASRIAAALSTLGIGGIASRLGFSASTLAGRRDESKADNHTSTAKDRLAKFAGPLFLIMLIGVLGILNEDFIFSLPGWMPWLPGAERPFVCELYAIGVFGFVALAFSLPINVNRFSLHAMYRARLVRTYLGASRPNRNVFVNRFTDLDEADNLSLADLSQHRPLHIVNIALNLVGGKNLAWQQRKAESFTASRLRTGSLRVGYQKSSEYAQRGRPGTGLTLGSAITISGAAASPNMGYHSSPIVSLVMTLFNARLGWWLANPGPKGKGKWRNDGPTMSFTPIINEALGRTNDESKWVYLSDGGHFENLGVYEMILRRCKTIVIVDGSQDNSYGFEDLGNAVRKVRVDLGIPIEFRFGLPMYGARDVRNRYCAIGKILYHCVDGIGENGEVLDGTIVYIKACLNGSEPTDVLHYASSAAEFPQQGTEQLWFDESQFESYRRLGAHIVEKIWEQKPVSSVGTHVDQFADAAEAYIASKPTLKFIGWPKPVQFSGSATGTIVNPDVKLKLDFEQL